jgi:hypothetical protein
MHDALGRRAGRAEAPVDLALTVDVYHELGDPQTMLANIKKALKPDAWP